MMLHTISWWSTHFSFKVKIVHILLIIHITLYVHAVQVHGVKLFSCFTDVFINPELHERHLKKKSLSEAFSLENLLCSVKFSTTAFRFGAKPPHGAVCCTLITVNVSAASLQKTIYNKQPSGR